MAKERDGSINIYGSLQARTEDGIVAYTDGIAHENEDGTKTPLDQLLKDSGGIIDVDKLPQLTGTLLISNPETMVNKVIFNDKLSIEDTIAILSQLTYHNFNGNQASALYSNATATSAIIVAKNSDTDYRINHYTNVQTFTFTRIFSSVVVDEGVGWINTEYEINQTGVTSLMGLPIGNENEKLRELVSMNDGFTINVNDKAIYRLKEPDKTHLEGTLLVSNSETTVNKVLFNDSLPNETMNQILGSLTYTEFNGLNVNVLFTNATATKVIFAYNYADNKYGLYYSTNIASGSADVVFYDDGRGWVTNEIEINDVGVSSLYGLSIGTNNESLQQVLSMNDNFTEVADSYKYTYWIYKDKWVQLLTNEEQIYDIGSVAFESDNETSYITSIDTSTINVFELIKNNKIKVKILIGTEVIIDEDLILQKIGEERLGTNEITVKDSITYSCVFNTTEKYEGGTSGAYTWLVCLTIDNINYKITLFMQRLLDEGNVTSGVNQNSNLLITSGGVYNALQNVGGSAIVDVDVLPEEPKSDVIYRLNENEQTFLGYTGTAVPNTGTFGSLYINQNIGITELKNILNRLTLTNASVLGQSGFEFYPMLAYMNGSYPYVLAFKKYTEEIDSHLVGDINIAIINFATMGTIQGFYISSGTGWQTFENPYPINATLLSELSGISIGTQNDIISSVFSSTLFLPKEGNKYTYWIYKNKWVQLNDSEEHYIIEKPMPDYLSSGFNGITLEIEEIYKAIKAKECILVLYGDNGRLYFRKALTQNLENIKQVCFIGNQIGFDATVPGYVYPYPVNTVLIFSTNNTEGIVKEATPNIVSFDYNVSDLTQPRIQLVSYNGFTEKYNFLHFDIEPYKDSKRLVSSGGVYNALLEKQNKITVTENDDGTVDITIPTE